MLAAIGLIIFSKQIHVLLGIDPATLKGLEPIELYELIPHSFMNADPRVAIVGIVSLVIIFGMPLLKGKIFKVIPAPMVVLCSHNTNGIDYGLPSYRTGIRPREHRQLLGKHQLQRHASTQSEQAYSGSTLLCSSLLIALSHC